MKNQSGALGPRYANEIKNWCFGAIGANISRQIQVYSRRIHWAQRSKQMSFNKLKMWAVRLKTLCWWAARVGWSFGDGASPMGVWKVRCFSMPDWFCGVGGVCGWQATPPAGKGNPNAATRKTNAAKLPPTFDASLMKLPKRQAVSFDMAIETPFCGLVTQSSWLQQAVDIN